MSTNSNITFETSVNNAGLSAGLNAGVNMVDKFKAQVEAKFAAIGKGAGTATMFGMGGISNLGKASSEMERMIGVSGRLGGALDRITGLFNSGLGIGVALGGMAALTGAFARAINKAKEFEVAQLSIAATIQSSYKILDSRTGKPLNDHNAFAASMQEAQKLNQDIIRRQAKNILTYEEELMAFQSALAPGARKGLSTKEVLDVSETAAIVAKSIGLRGEQIANAARLIMGGGVNVARSTIGRVLGISNQDILGKSGDEYIKFIKEKMKGFLDADMQSSFAKSIEGVMSTLEAKFDVFWAKIGKRFIEGIKPAMEQLGGLLEGESGKNLEDTFVKLFSGIATGIEKIAKSPAIPMMMKFFEFLANNADKIVITAALMKLVQILGAIGNATKDIMTFFTGLSARATEATAAINGLAAANQNLAVAEAEVVAAGGGVGGGTGGLVFVPGNNGKGGKYIGTNAAKKRELQAIAAKEESQLEAMMAGGLATVGMAAIPVGLTAKQQKALANTRMSARPSVVGNFMAQNAAGAMASQMEAQMGAEYLATMQMDSLAKAAAARAAADAVKIPLGERFGAGIANAKMYGAKALPYIGKMGNAGLTALLATQLGGMILPQSVQQSPEWDLGQKAIIGGATLAPLIKPFLSATGGLALGSNALSLSGIVGAGGVAGALGIAGGVAASALAGWKIGSYINDKMWARAKAAEQAAQEGEEWQKYNLKDYDLIKEKQRLRDQRAAILRNEGRTESVYGWDGGVLPRWHEREIPGTKMDKSQVDKAVASIDKKLADLEAQSHAVMATNDLADKSKQMGIAAKNLQAIAQVGYGPEQIGRQIQAEIAQRKAQIQQMFVDGTITESQRNKLNRETEQWAKDQRAKEALDKKQLEASLGPRTIDNQLKQGLLGVESQMLPWKGKLPAEEYQKLLEKAKERFEKDFNKPLKEIEQNLQALSMGVSSENVVESLTGAYQAMKLKLKDMVDVPQKIKDKVLAQAKAQLEADLALNADQMANQSYGLNRIASRTQSELNTRAAKRAQMMYDSASMGMSSQAEGYIQNIEGARGMLNPTMLKAYATNMFQEMMFSMQQAMKQTAIEGKQLDLQGRQADMAAKTWNWNMTAADQREEQWAEQEAREKLAAERGPVSYDDRVRNAEDNLRMQGESAQLQQQTIQLQKEAFEHYKNAPKMLADFSNAVKVATTALNNLFKPGKDGKPTVGSTVNNNVEVKVDPKVGMTPKEVDKLADEVKDKICKAMRGK
jgi:hypothetical protein